jgi:hypothetical protein
MLSFVCFIVGILVGLLIAGALFLVFTTEGPEVIA